MDTTPIKSFPAVQAAKLLKLSIGEIFKNEYAMRIMKRSQALKVKEPVKL